MDVYTNNVYMYSFILVYIYVRIYLYIYAYVCAYVFLYVYIYVSKCMFIYYDNVTIYILFFNIWVALAIAVIFILNEGLAGM